jgi:phospholipase C
MKPTFDLRRRWRTTTALCIVSTLAVVTASYAADWGRSNWDSRSHFHPGELNHNNGNGNGNGNNNNGNSSSATAKTASPIKHVIILIGENRGLDHAFGVYKPKGAGQTISNLLSKGIVNEDGSQGPNFALAQQYSVAGQPSYYIGAPAIGKSPTDPAIRCRSPTPTARRARKALPVLRSRPSQKPALKRTSIRLTSTS